MNIEKSHIAKYGRAESMPFCKYIYIFICRSSNNLLFFFFQNSSKMGSLLELKTGALASCMWATQSSMFHSHSFDPCVQIISHRMVAISLSSSKALEVTVCEEWKPMLFHMNK